jgi:glycosyltransferase involved in cell wall biosynthesis
MGQMKILVIHEVSYLRKVIFEMHEFPELLSIAGHEVHFLEFPEGLGFKNISLKKRSRWINGRVHSTAKLKLITPFTLGGSFFDRLIAPLTVLPTLWALFSKGSYDVVLLYSVPTSGWQTVRIAKHFKIPVVFRALDVSHLIREGITSRLVGTAERYVYKNATLISANNPELGRYTTSVGSRDDIARVNNPPLELTHFAKGNRNEIRVKLGIPADAFVVCYMGSLFPFSGLSQVVNDFSKLADQNDYLIIVGDGEVGPSLINEAKALEIENKVVFTGTIDYSVLPEYLSSADVLINPFEPKLLTNIAFPHKVLQYMATGIPVVSTKLTGLYGVIGDMAGVNWVDCPNEVITKSFSLKALTRAEVEEIGKLGRDFVSQEFSQEKSLQNLVATLEESIKKMGKEK